MADNRTNISGLDLDSSTVPTGSKAAAAPIATSGVAEPERDTGTADPAPVSSQSMTSKSDCVAKPVVSLRGISEIARDGKTSTLTTWEPPFEVEKGFEASFAEICHRAESVLAPTRAISLPTGATPYGTTDELFTRLHKAIAAQICPSERASRLLTYWTLSTWFPDVLFLAPGLAISGRPYEGDLILRTLRNFCRCPLLLMRADMPSLKNVKWNINPTLLFHDPNVTKQMASLLGSTATRGHLVDDAGVYRDFFGPKAIYLGEEVTLGRTPHCSVQVNVPPTAITCASDGASRLTELEVQDLQNMLMGYRLKNLIKVYHSDFDAAALTSDTRAVANALGACIIDSPGLQSELMSLLTPVESQRQTDLSTGLEAVILEATLNLYHAGKEQIRAGEIATEVNRIGHARGEVLRYKAEIIGHRLKKVGLFTRRLGMAGRGLVMDLATIAKVHQLAAAYGGVGLDLDEKTLHCHSCTENKRLM